MTDYGALFKELYATKRFGGYGSGGGSCELNAWPYMRLVERVLAAHHPRTVLDVGCGDGRVASGIHWGTAHYIGVDATPEAVDMISARLWPNSEVHVLDALREPLPEADLVLCKEVTQHLETDAVTALLMTLSRYKLVLHCSAVANKVNSNILAGDCRTIDLSYPPFSLPVEMLLYWQCAGTYLCQLWKP